MANIKKPVEMRIADEDGNLNRDWSLQLGRLFQAVSDPFQHFEATVATLPDVAKYKFRTVFVTDESGGPVAAFSDGTHWRRYTDRAIVS